MPDLLRLTASGYRDDQGASGEAQTITLTRSTGDDAIPRLTLALDGDHITLTPDEADEVMSAIADFMRTV